MQGDIIVEPSVRASHEEGLRSGSQWRRFDEIFRTDFPTETPGEVAGAQ